MRRFLLAAVALACVAADGRLEEARRLQQKGSLPEAQALYRAVVPELRKNGDTANLASALNALSAIGWSLGDYEAAIADGREAAESYRRLGDVSGEARARNNVGLAYLYRGDYEPALRYFGESLELHRSRGEVESEIVRLNNIGNAYYFQGRYLDAFRHYQAALDRVNQTAAETWNARRRQMTIANLATLYQKLGREDRALELYLKLRRDAVQLRPSEEARLLGNLGALYRRLGDPIKALETYRQAQNLFERERLFDGEIGVMKNIGIAHALDLENYPEALRAFDAAVGLAERAGNQREAIVARLYRGEVLYRSGRVEKARGEWETARERATKLGMVDEEWRALDGLGRVAERLGQRDQAAGYFRQAVTRIESVRSRLERTELKLEFLEDKRDVYDALMERVIDEGAGGAPFLELLERARAATFQDRLRDGARSPSLEAVQAKLDDATVVLAYWVGRRRSAVLWMTQSAAGVAERKFTDHEAERVLRLVDLLAGDSGDGWRREAEALGEVLLGGLDALRRPGLRRVVIVPDGVLSYLPFEVLKGPSGGPLVETAEVFYLPSTTVLLRPEKRGERWNPPWRRQLVAFGDPQPQETGERLAGDARWGRLPESAAEVRAIARMMTGRSELYLGPAAQKKRLFDSAPGRATFLHFSTHAAVDSEVPERSRILFSPEGAQAADYLFLSEIAGLDLNGVDLVTVSACETERGRMIRGEGVEAFSRAFLAAGARATVTSLWRVADAPASAFMQQFYYFLSRGKTKGEALRLAKLRFLQSGSPLAHPRHWAAFVLNGDGMRPAASPTPWSKLLLFFAAIALALGLVFVLVFVLDFVFPPTGLRFPAA